MYANPAFLKAQETISSMCRMLRRIHADVLPAAADRLASSERRCNESIDRELQSRDRLLAPGKAQR